MIHASSGRIKKLIIFDREQQPLPKNATGDFVYKSLLNYYSDFFKKLPAGIPLEIIIFYDIQHPYPHPRGLKTKHVVPDRYSDITIVLYCTNLVTDPENKTIPSDWVQDWIIPDQNNKWYYSNPAAGLPEHLREYLRTLLNNIQFQELKEECQGGNLLQGEQGGIKYLLVGGYRHTAAENAKLGKLFAIDPKNIIRINPIVPSLKTENPHLFHLDLFISIIGQVDYPFAGKADLVLVAKAPGTDPVSDEINRTISYAIRDLKQHPSLNFVLIEIPFLVFSKFNLAYNNCHIQNYIENGIRRISVCFPSFIIPMQKKAAKLWNNDQQELSRYAEEIQQYLEVYRQYRPGKRTRTEKRVSTTDKLFMQSFKKDIRLLNNYIEAELELTLKAIGIDSIKFIKANFTGLAHKRGSLHCMSLAVERE